MEIKDILRKRREELGLSCEEVGKKIGVSGSTVSRWEVGEISSIKKDKIVALSEVLNISPAVIMGWDTGDIENDAVSKLRHIYRNLTPENQMLYLSFGKLLISMQKKNNK